MGRVTGQVHTVHSLFVPAVLLIFYRSQRPILLSKFKKLTNTAGTIKGRVQITNLRYTNFLEKSMISLFLCIFIIPFKVVFRFHAKSEYQKNSGISTPWISEQKSFWRKILQNRWTRCFFRLVCFPSKNSFLICCFLLQAIIMVPPNRPKILGEWTLGAVQLPIHQAQMVRLQPMWTSPVLTPVRKANDVATVLM